jgi:hypothetical protein
MGTLLADFLTRAAVAHLRRQRRPTLVAPIKGCGIGVNRRREIIAPHNWPRRRSEVQESWSEWQDLNLRPSRPERGALRGKRASSEFV